MWKLALAIYECPIEECALARQLCEEQPMADGQGIEFILFSSSGR